MIIVVVFVTLNIILTYFIVLIGKSSHVNDVVVHYQKSESITVGNIDIVMLVILSLIYLKQELKLY